MSPMIASGTGDRGPGINSLEIRSSDQAPGPGGGAEKRACRRSLLPGFRSLGFTLLEMLAVIVLLGVVAVIVARSVAGRVDSGKWKAGTIGVTKLDQDVQAYALDNGSPPKSLDDLIAKPLNAPSWNGPYAKPPDLKDPFGHPYGYVYPGKHGQYDIVFLGRDGKPNGEGVDRDYGNWQ